MRYSLRTLLVVMLVAGPLCAFGWLKWSAYLEAKARAEAKAQQTIQWPSGITVSGQIPIRGCVQVVVDDSFELDPYLQAEIARLEKEERVAAKEFKSFVETIINEPLPGEPINPLLDNMPADKLID